MDLKEAGNELWVLGFTQSPMGGSVWANHYLSEPAPVPTVDQELALKVFHALHAAIRKGLIRSCHDISEGGLAVTLAEMAMGGHLGLRASLRDIPCQDGAAIDTVLLYNESPSRFVVEVAAGAAEALAELWAELPVGRLGEVVGAGQPGQDRVQIKGLDQTLLIDSSISELKTAWKQPLDWFPKN